MQLKLYRKLSIQISLCPRLSILKISSPLPPTLLKSLEYLQAGTSSQAPFRGSAQPVPAWSSHPPAVAVSQFPEQLMSLNQNQVFVFFQLKEGGAEKLLDGF